MILGPKGTYLFVEIPHTATTAIAAELVDHYGGTSILSKHTTAFEFNRSGVKLAPGAPIVASIRDPFDFVFTFYTKLRTGHDGFLDSPAAQVSAGGHVTPRMRKMRRRIVSGSLSYSEFLLRSYRWPYDAYGGPSLDQFDIVMRFENLQADFSAMLAELRLEQLRPLPKKNQSNRGELNLQAEFGGDDRQKASNILGPLALEWGYSMPDGFPEPTAFSVKTFSGIRELRRRSEWDNPALGAAVRKARSGLVA